MWCNHYKDAVNNAMIVFEDWSYIICFDIDEIDIAVIWTNLFELLGGIMGAY